MTMIIKVMEIGGILFVGTGLMILGIYVLLFVTPIEVLKFCLMVLVIMFFSYLIPWLARKHNAKQEKTS